MFKVCVEVTAALVGISIGVIHAFWGNDIFFVLSFFCSYIFFLHAEQHLKEYDEERELKISKIRIGSNEFLSRND